jgi:uncharacterized membrane protein (DUF106 family)
MCESQKTEQAKLSHDILCEQFGTVLCSVILILAFSFIPYVDWAAHVVRLLSYFPFFSLNRYCLPISSFLGWFNWWFCCGNVTFFM